MAVLGADDGGAERGDGSDANQVVRRRRDTVSGGVAVSLVGFIVILATLASWAASGGDEGRDIGRQMGLWVGGGLALAIALLAWAPTWFERDFFLRWVGNRLVVLFAPLGRLLSAIDALLVEHIAVLGGATIPDGAIRVWRMQFGVTLRYTVLAFHMLPVLYLGWTAEPAVALAALAWGMLLTVAIARRWAWIEDDREIAMISGKFATGPTSPIRVGFKQDLRDEALVGYLIFLAIIPLALRQLDNAFSVFTHADGVDYWDWFGFFGAELAKAVPFVDWAEVYHINNTSNVQANTISAQHLTFLARILVDLLLLSALLQSIDVVGRVRRQRKMFWDGEIKRLDPFLEKPEFHWLADLKNVDELPEGIEHVDVRAAVVRQNAYYPEQFVDYDASRIGDLFATEPSDVRLLILNLLYLRNDGTLTEFVDRAAIRSESSPHDSNSVVRTRAVDLAILSLRHADIGAKSQWRMLLIRGLRTAENDPTVVHEHFDRRKIVDALADDDVQEHARILLLVRKHDSRGSVRMTALRRLKGADAQTRLEALLSASEDRRANTDQQEAVAGLEEFIGSGLSTDAQRTRAINALRDLRQSGRNSTIRERAAEALKRLGLTPT